MDNLFEKMYNKKIKKKDLDSAIFCYSNKQYKACSLLLFGLIDSRIIKLQPKESKRHVGLGGTSKLKSKLEEKLTDEHFLFESLYHINLIVVQSIITEYHLKLQTLSRAH